MTIRSRAQRQRDTEDRLKNDVDLWVASASADGAPYLVPLSFDWDGTALLLATPAASPTGRNLAGNRAVRLALGPTRDVTMIEGTVEILEMNALPGDLGDRFAAHWIRSADAGNPLPLVPRVAGAHRYVAGGRRAGWSRADARRPLARMIVAALSDWPERGRIVPPARKRNSITWAAYGCPKENTGVIDDLDIGNEPNRDPASCR
jgi:hypothetical protein